MAGKKADVPLAATATKDHVHRLIQIQSNHLLLLTLREVSILVAERMNIAKVQIDKLTKERKGSKSPASYRQANALRRFRANLDKLLQPLKAQSRALRTEQIRLVSSAPNLNVNAKPRG